MAGRNRPAIGADERLALNRMGSFDWDLRHRTLELDAAGLAVFDLRAGEYDGDPETLRPRLPPEEGMRLDSTVDRAIRGGRSSYGAYFQVKRRNGLRQWTHVRARILRDDRGVPHRVIGIVRNASTELTEFPEISPDEAGRRRLTTILQGITEALSRAVTVDDVTDVLSDSGGLERFGADGLALGIVDGGSVKLVALSGVSLGRAGDPPGAALEESMPLAEAALTRRARFSTSLPGLGEAPDLPELTEAADDPAVLGPYACGQGFDAAAFLPLVAEARAIGGLALFYRGRTHFTAEDREICLGLAGIVAQSLRRAILFDEEREFATGLQASMLPRDIPSFSGAEIAVRYHAAWSGREVGGDWYDVIALPGGRVGVVVGDVQGHDTHAAAIMGQLRIALRAFAGEGHPPATVLARASRFLVELDTERFATCTYAQLDLSSGVVRAVRAGHLGPIVRHTDGRTGWPHLRGGLPLGLATEFGQEDFPETRLDLVPGETFVLCTDGLVEEPGLDITEGMGELAHAVRTGPGGADPLADHLADGLWQRWATGDDVALLVLHRAPDPGTRQAPRIHQYIHQADPEGLVETRSVLRQALVDWNMPALVDDVQLAAGEMLVNVLLHTEGSAVLTLEVVPGPVRRVRLWVKDRSSAWPRRRWPGEAATSGRGLLMIDAVAARWGVEPRGDGKAVWCEFTPTGRAA
ncbi:magnesium or manganese-dependent protein phosphatase [Streptomyces camponoticapitis]|uniref:Magnesium or manganese-dependent protein phosphatase n=1 Tax=Streptomyces camponoticapitis TaxID=1616125 RepID=A0ABQ2DYL5_9ACTN|nr:SpoIIE family protein phosphatase [Streptomyces camponoticapitis]GGJ77489.1 magnesium or manganese-dependent protein phosphatase [Streptomyces camponoticapitis]